MPYHNALFLTMGQCCKYEIPTPRHMKNNLASTWKINNMLNSAERAIYTVSLWLETFINKKQAANM